MKIKNANALFVFNTIVMDDQDVEFTERSHLTHSETSPEYNFFNTQSHRPELKKVVYFKSVVYFQSMD